MINANSSVEKMNIEELVVEEAGPASDCVQLAKAVTVDYANNPGNTGDPNDYMWLYHATYSQCMSEIQ